MADTDPLAALKPLIAPPAVPWWPPAPGWWLLGIALLVLSVALAVWGWQRWRRHCGTRYQREALALLGPLDNVQAIAQLVRRAAISAYGREHAAAADWKTLCPGMDAQSLQLLAESQYRADPPPAAAVAQLREQVRRWLTGLPMVKR